MIGLPRDGNGAGVPFLRKRFDGIEGFDVCWAGSHPFEPGFCFGSTDGRLLLTDETGQALGDVVKSSASGEAINGVASWQDWVSISTRAEVTFDCVGPRKTRLMFDVGSHGVIATKSGYFLAPLGPSGLMTLKPQAGAPNQAVDIINPSAGQAYFYRVICLRAPDGGEVLAFAHRTSGLGAMLFTGSEDHPLNEISYAGLDVIDVCAVPRADAPLAVAAVGKDGTLILSRDALHDKHPVTMRFEQVQGAAYRLLSARGHLFLLTSQALYLMFGLAERFLSREPVTKSPAPVAVVPMEAVDANLYQDEWLLTVMPDEVHAHFIGEGRQDNLEIVRRKEIRSLTPTALSHSWSEQELHPNRTGAGVG